MSVSYIRTGDTLNIVFEDGVSAQVNVNSDFYSDIRNALNEKDYTTVRALALPAERVAAKLQSTLNANDPVKIEHGVVSYEGRVLHNSLTTRMLDMLAEGFDITPLKLFLINLQQNPSFRAVNELYGFLEKGKLPITEDGFFLAYKKVRGDYKDVHSGTFDNSVGKIVEMPRNTVDEDSRNECSKGLHFCSRDYLGAFSGERTVIVKINPADVVAIPADYNSSKGRACKYAVIGELTQNSPHGVTEEKLEGTYRDTGTQPSWQQTSDGGWLPEDEVDEDDDFDLDEYDETTDDNLESPIPTEHSAFLGIPGDGLSVVVPQGVAVTIAADLDDTDMWEVESYDPNTNQTVTRYDTIRDAADENWTSVSAINRVLRGDRKTTAGYGWRRNVLAVITPVDSTLPNASALTEHQKHGTLFGGQPHETGGKHNAKAGKVNS